jgi:hypothetical protein
MNTTKKDFAVNIVKQASPSCRGEHADAERIYTGGMWRLSDNSRNLPVIETLRPTEDETPEQFNTRCQHRADEVDRELNCYRCYQR